MVQDLPSPLRPAVRRPEYCVRFLAHVAVSLAERFNRRLRTGLSHASTPKPQRGLAIDELVLVQEVARRLLRMFGNTSISTLLLRRGKLMTEAFKRPENSIWSPTGTNGQGVSSQPGSSVGLGGLRDVPFVMCADAETFAKCISRLLQMGAL